MNAPEVRVRVERRASDDTYYAECGACRQILATGYTSVATLDLALAEMDHENDCAPTQLARLQARWDARTEAERALIEKWRAESGNWQVDRCADELERAIGGGK